MTFRPELLDELLQSYQNPEDLLGDGGILKQLTAALVERCLKAELEHHLEEERSEPAENATPRNRRNGHSKKTIKGEFGEAEIVIPRDRNGAFEPVIVQKGQTRFDGFDGKILSLYARGMSVRDIQAQLQDLYGVEVSAGLISARYGCSRGGTQALAKPGTRPGLSDCLLRCHCGQSPARRARG